MAILDTALPIERADVAATFIDRVETLAAERGWTLERCGTEAGLARGAMRRYRFENSAPRLDIAYRLAVALDTTLDDLLDPHSPIGARP